MSQLLLTLLVGGASGFVIGWLGSLVLPGKEVVSKPEMFIIGTGAGMLAGLICNIFGWDDGDGIRWVRLIIGVVFAAIASYFWVAFRNRQVKQAVTPDRLEKDNRQAAKESGGKESGGKGLDMPGPGSMGPGGKSKDGGTPGLG